MIKVTAFLCCIFLLSVCGCDRSQTEEEVIHPAATANIRCAEHGGVENISVDKYGGFIAATCKDGTAVEIE